jgi:hypothetical protein
MSQGAIARMKERERVASLGTVATQVPVVLVDSSVSFEMPETRVTDPSSQTSDRAKSDDPCDHDPAHVCPPISETGAPVGVASSLTDMPTDADCPCGTPSACGTHILEISADVTPGGEATCYACMSGDPCVNHPREEQIDGREYDARCAETERSTASYDPLPTPKRSRKRRIT